MKKSILLSLLLLFPIVSFADEGSVSMPFMAQDLNPSSAAIGSISLFNNAASSVLRAGTGHVQAGYQLWKPVSGNDIFVDAHYKFKDIAALRLEFADRIETPYDIVDDFGETVGQFKPGSLRAVLGASFKFAKYFSVGADVIYARRSLYEGTAYNTVAGNFAFMVKKGVFNMALGAKNVGVAVKNSEGTASFNTPGSAFADLGFNILIKEKHSIFFGGEFEYMFHNAIAYGAGLSYTYNDMVSIRGGYHGGGLVPNHFSAGLGLKFKGITLNATALLAKEYMNGTLLIGLGYEF